MRKLMFLLGYSLVGVIGWNVYLNIILPDEPGRGQLNDIIATSQEPSHSPDHIYRWQDANGEWQFSDHPPQEQNVEAQIVAYQQELKDLQKVRQTLQAAQPQATGALQQISGPASDSSGLNPFSIFTQAEKVYQLAQDAVDVQSKLDHRKAELDETLKQANR